MLELPRRFRDAIVAHARRDHPDECCGVLTGTLTGNPTGSGEVRRMVEMQNAERSPTGFTFESGEWLRVNREMDEYDEEVVVVYHSHTMTEAAPSRTDIRWAANTPGAHWLLVSTRDPELDEVRSFVIDGETVTEESVVLVDG